MHGISIQHLTLPKLKIENLYIKLDKKFTVSAYRVDFKRDSKSQTSSYEINKIISYFKYLNPLFKSISLKNINYNDEKVSLLYKDDIFYANSKFLTLDAKVTQEAGRIIDLKINQMILKDYKIELKGELALNLKKKIYNYNGRFNILNIDGNASIDIDGNILNYKLKTDTFNSLKPIMKFINSKVFIEPLANAWIYKKIVAKRYKLDYLKGRFNLKTKEFYPKLIKGRATAKNVRIKFHPLVAPAYAKQVKVKLSKNTLSFYLLAPTYEKKKIKINDIHIYNILTSKNGIIVNISSNTLLDKYIHNILKNFGINIPITQASGNNHSNIVLDVKFRPFSIDAKGEFTVKNSKFKILGVPFYTKYAKIRLDNYDVFLQNSNIVYKKLFSINTTGILKTKKKIYSGKADINSLVVDMKGTHILQISRLKNQQVYIKMSKNKNTIEIDNLKTKLIFKKNYNQFILQDISKYIDFSTIIKENKINKGTLSIFTKDFKKYNAKLKIYDIKTPIIYHKKNVKDFDIDIATDGKKISAHTLNGMISLAYDKHIILNVKDFDILLDNNNTKISHSTDFSINGRNVNFLLNDLNSTMLSNSFTLNKFKNEIRFNSLYKNSQLGFEYNRSSFSLHASNLSGYFLNTILNKNIFSGGTFNLKSKGISYDMFDGEFRIRNSVLKDFSLFNNIMATINTIPSLVFLKDPNFNEQGYLVKNGILKFKKNGNILSFGQIKLHGTSADISGYGYLDLKTKEINMDLQIKTLKDISKIIKNIPLIGYIILGDDKSISTNIEVSGSVYNPKVETQILQDTIMSPLNIIKRTIKSPLKLFN
ncbi:MAG: AsmA-like C-terminal domain-containing protein [Sulfurospirillum sp.]